MFSSIFDIGVVGKACQRNDLDFRFHNLRDYTTNRYQTVDDAPYGGGGGLVFKIEPLIKALRDIKVPDLNCRTLLLSPRGEILSTEVAKRLAAYDQLILFCGRYEGVDERFSEYIDGEISIGDYVLSGGELPAMVVMDVVSRFVPGVVGQEEGPYKDSFAEGLLEYPTYTRPREFEGKQVPEVLLSGHHRQVEEWREREARNSTLQRRPDLLEKTQLFEGLEVRHGKKTD